MACPAIFSYFSPKPLFADRRGRHHAGTRDETVVACAYKACFDVDAPHRLGDELFVNVPAPQGQVRVAIAEKAGDYHAALSKHDGLPGFSLADCIPITGDQVRAPVRFQKTRIADIPADKPINLRFELTRAEVFGYEWKT